MGHEKLKNIVWIGSSREELKKFPEPIKDEIGYAIYRAQNCIYVLHTFKKKSHKGIKTPKPDMEIIRKRLKEARILAKEVK